MRQLARVLQRPSHLRVQFVRACVKGENDGQGEWYCMIMSS